MPDEQPCSAGWKVPIGRYLTYGTDPVRYRYDFGDNGRTRWCSRRSLPTTVACIRAAWLVRALVRQKMSAVRAAPPSSCGPSGILVTRSTKRCCSGRAAASTLTRLVRIWSRSIIREIVSKAHFKIGVALSYSQMEPSRQTVCAIMSLRRAAHLERWADRRGGRKRERPDRTFTPLRPRSPRKSRTQ